MNKLEREKLETLLKAMKLQADEYGELSDGFASRSDESGRNRYMGRAMGMDRAANMLNTLLNEL